MKKRTPCMPLRAALRYDTITMTQALTDIGPCIYYAWIAGYIKIGFATDLGRRFLVYPPNTRLLAWRTDATLADEQELHRKLRGHAVERNEWYLPTPAMLEVVNEAREACGIPTRLSA